MAVKEACNRGYSKMPDGEGVMTIAVLGSRSSARAKGCAGAPSAGIGSTLALLIFGVLAVVSCTRVSAPNVAIATDRSTIDVYPYPGLLLAKDTISVTPILLDSLGGQHLSGFSDASVVSSDARVLSLRDGKLYPGMSGRAFLIIQATVNGRRMSTQRPVVVSNVTPF